MSDDDLIILELRMKLEEAYNLLRACIPYVEQFHQKTVFGDGAKNVLDEIKAILNLK